MAREKSLYITSAQFSYSYFFMLTRSFCTLSITHPKKQMVAFQQLVLADSVYLNCMLHKSPAYWAV